MLRNTPIWYLTEDKSGSDIKIPAVFLKEDDNCVMVEILENAHGICSGVEFVDIRDCAIRKV